MIFTRQYEQTDYATVRSWWEKQGWVPLPPDSLPNGFIAYDEDSLESLAAAFIYNTKEVLHIMEWIVGNPETSPELRGLGIEAVVSACLKLAGERGATTVITTTKHKRLIERYKNMGFLVADEGMTHLIKQLKIKS